jgi:8-oxo-dGTP pyrophosphatase MutT (NUDIX family)
MQGEFVLSFAFSQDLMQTVTILKNRPVQLAGKKSVPGGHIEEEDATPQHAASREFFEETGVTTDAEDWMHIDTFAGLNDCPVHIYASCSDRYLAATTCSDEDVFVETVKAVLEDARLDEKAAYYIRQSLMRLKK